jgi:hypothetical protein
MHDLNDILSRREEIDDNIARALSTCATPGEILIRTLRNLEVSLQRHDENEDAALIHRLIESLKP